MRNGLGVLFMVLIGCSPGSYSGGGGGAGGATTGSGGSGGGVSGPQNFFNQNVAPILMQSCAACHLGAGSPTAPHFLGQSQSAMYTALKGNASLTGNPNQSLLLTKGMHEGPALTMAQSSTVHLWLTMEHPGSTDPNGGTGGTGGAGGSGGIGGTGGTGGTGGIGGTGGTPGGGTNNPTCNDLADCCAQLPPDYQADCENLVSGLDENVCQQILDGLQQQGLCVSP